MAGLERSGDLERDVAARIAFYIQRSHAYSSAGNLATAQRWHKRARRLLNWYARWYSKHYPDERLKDAYTDGYNAGIHDAPIWAQINRANNAPQN